MGAATSVSASSPFSDSFSPSSFSSSLPPSHRFASVVTSASHLPPATRPPVVSVFFSFRLASPAPSFLQDAGQSLSPLLPRIRSLFAVPDSPALAPCSVSTLSARLFQRRRADRGGGGILVASFARIEVLSSAFGSSLYELVFPREWGGCTCGTFNEDAALKNSPGVVFLAFRDRKIRCFSPENLNFLGELALPGEGNETTSGTDIKKDRRNTEGEGRQKDLHKRDSSGPPGDADSIRSATPDLLSPSTQRILTSSSFSSPLSASAFPTVLTCPMNNSVISGDAAGGVCAFFLGTRQVAATYEVPACLLARQKALLESRQKRKNHRDSLRSFSQIDSEKETKHKEGRNSSPSSSSSSFSSVDEVAAFGERLNSHGLFSVSTLHFFEKKRLLFVAYGQPLSPSAGASASQSACETNEEHPQTVRVGEPSACTEKSFSRLQPASPAASVSLSGASESPGALSASCTGSESQTGGCVSALSPVSGRRREEEFVRRPPALHDFSLSSPSKAEASEATAGASERSEESPSKSAASGVFVSAERPAFPQFETHGATASERSWCPEEEEDSREKSGDASPAAHASSGVEWRPSSLYPVLVFGLETGKCLGCLWGAQTRVVALHVGAEWSCERETRDRLWGENAAKTAGARGGRREVQENTRNPLWCVAVTETEILVWRQEKTQSPNHRNLRGETSLCPSFFCGLRADGWSPGPHTLEATREERRLEEEPLEPRRTNSQTECRVSSCPLFNSEMPSWGSSSSSSASSSSASGSLSSVPCSSSSSRSSSRPRAKAEGGVLDGVVWRLVSRICLASGVQAFASWRATEREHPTRENAALFSRARAVGAALDPEEGVLSVAVDPGEDSKLCPRCIFWKIRRKRRERGQNEDQEELEIRPWRQLALRPEPSAGTTEQRHSLSPPHSISSFWYDRVSQTLAVGCADGTARLAYDVFRRRRDQWLTEHKREREAERPSLPYTTACGSRPLPLDSVDPLHDSPLLLRLPDVDLTEPPLGGVQPELDAFVSCAKPLQF
ncbi:hypothetical protein TGVEG_267280 [Toxoplasma gondii VEG]|uniref:Uncharacterized protein n=1 Tax=Toxoplasma gondii (strain ATCC 50861 / VEG) TaxID=432359 RepID=B9QP88_TOXGV|nr:hypothetical protein TGVEG_267280 [Toxoplasma gondii VEG]CEL75549.1 TPA: hypothetical protein BN1205_085730 [Toxoplasma gondii VEG]